MIEYKVNYGNRAGTHYIFESTTEAIECLKVKPELNVNNQDLSNPFNAFKNWFDNTLVEGDWVKSDEGKVIQVWKVYKMNTHSTYNQVHCIKTCIGTFNYYRNKPNAQFPEGRVKSTNRLCITSDMLSRGAKHKGSMGEQRLLGKNKTQKKRWFAYYCAITGNPHTALVILQKTLYKAPKYGDDVFYSRRFILNAFELLKDPQIIELIKGWIPMEKFKDKLKNALNNEGVSEEFLAINIKEGLEANLNNPKRVGGLAHKQFIELGLNALKYIDDDTKTIDGKPNPLAITEGNTTDVKFEEVLPDPKDKLLPVPNMNPRSAKDKEFVKGLNKDIIAKVEEHNDKVLEEYDKKILEEDRKNNADTDKKEGGDK